MTQPKEEQSWEERFDEKFPKLGHLHDQNCEFECHLRPDLKSFIETELRKQEEELKRKYGIK